MRTTLKQVADDTGLSIATVSRALRRDKRRYSKNEEKIYASARKLGYPFIGELNNEEQLTIALVTEVHQGEFYSSLFNGFYNSSKNSESDIVFVNLAKHSDDPVQHIINLSKKYSGICLFLPNLEKIDYKRIRQGVGKYPIISLTPMKNPTIDTVSFDSYSGGYMIAKHFEEQGYKNFGIVSGPGDAVDAVFRKNGFVDHISEKEDLKLVWEYKGDFSSESGRDAFSNYKKQNIPNMAIFGCNDHTCFGFMKGALEAGYKIPKDFIIAGYDNLSFCVNFTPELTSVATNFDILGKRAIRTIENMVNDSNEIIRQFSMVPVEIVIRSSTQN
ncbi:MAG: LacI family DNA-binding transcriptional regulator [Candidatus Neomarinimicrobiota bacterium]